MEPKGGETRFELPPEPASPEDEAGQEQAVEAPPARQEQVGARPSQPALPAVPDDIPAADQALPGAPAHDVPSPGTDYSGPAAHDSEQIEREWVDKVKNVVARTQDDPHLQKEQVSKVKAEYIQKRFNKTIKTDEAA